jgi:hypothetical protein
MGTVMSNEPVAAPSPGSENGTILMKAQRQYAMDRKLLYLA